jgi:hypothetical protein
MAYNFEFPGNDFKVAKLLEPVHPGNGVNADRFRQGTISFSFHRGVG